MVELRKPHGHPAYSYNRLHSISYLSLPHTSEKLCKEHSMPQAISCRPASLLGRQEAGCSTSHQVLFKWRYWFAFLPTTDFTKLFQTLATLKLLDICIKVVECGYQVQKFLKGNKSQPYQSVFTKVLEKNPHNCKQWQIAKGSRTVSLIYAAIALLWHSL